MPIGFSVYGAYYLRVISYYVSFGQGLYRRIEDGVPEWGMVYPDATLLMIL